MRDVVLVLGAPCSGKTTFVRAHASPSDVVIDLDLIAEQLGSPVSHDHAPQFFEAAAKVRDRMETRVAQSLSGRAWVIRTSGRPSTRQRLVRRLKATRVVVLNPGIGVCLARAQDAGRSPAALSRIVGWFQEFDEGRNVPQAGRKGRR